MIFYERAKKKLKVGEISRGEPLVVYVRVALIHILSRRRARKHVSGIPHFLISPSTFIAPLYLSACCAYIYHHTNLLFVLIKVAIQLTLFIENPGFLWLLLFVKIRIVFLIREKSYLFSINFLLSYI